MTLPRNAYLKTGGTKDTNIYFVESGSIRIYILDKNEAHTIRFGYRNNFIVAMDSFITNQESDLYIQALKETKVRKMSKANFFDFVNSSSENQEVWNAMQQKLILQQLEREIDLLTSAPGERYERVLKRSPQLFQEIPLKYIANYLRMTPETLSRLKKS